MLLAALAGVLAGILAGVVIARRRGDRASDVPGATPPPADGIAVALDALPTAVAVVDADSTVTYANVAARRIGVADGDRLGTPELGRLVVAALRAKARTTRRIDLPGPPRVDVDAIAVPVPRTREVVLLADDTTEARRLDAVRRDFVVNVSHELKTPVGAMSLLAEAIAESRDDPETVRRFAGRIGVESSRLSRLVQELIDLSRLQGAEPMDVSPAVPVRRIAREAADRTQVAAAASGIDIVVGPIPDSLVVRGDEAQLVTAVTNLLSNAVAYSPEGTRVAVGARATDDGHVELAVTDEGIGIKPGEVDRIFERFYRVDPARSRATGGTGLGLSIVKHIVTNHGGRVDVWSIEGTGSTFTLVLPAGAVSTKRESA